MVTKSQDLNHGRKLRKVVSLRDTCFHLHDGWKGSLSW